MTEKGLIKIIGRTKELIIVGGENVYPREIEEILYTHPAVETVNVCFTKIMMYLIKIKIKFEFIIFLQVIGVPDPRKGEEICAWIQLHKDVKITEDEIREFCKGQVSEFFVGKKT